MNINGDYGTKFRIVHPKRTQEDGYQDAPIKNKDGVKVLHSIILGKRYRVPMAADNETDMNKTTQNNTSYVLNELPLQKAMISIKDTNHAEQLYQSKLLDPKEIHRLCYGDPQLIAARLKILEHETTDDMEPPNKRRKLSPEAKVENMIQGYSTFI